MAATAAAAIILVGLVIWRQPSPPPPPPPEQLSARDQARELAAKMWQDLLQAGHVAAIYRELYWRTANDNERLLVACKYGEMPLVEALVKGGADVNVVDHRTARHTAVESEGATPLMMAATSGRLELAKYLLEHGATLDHRDAVGATPLHCAIRSNHEDLAMLLLEHGADPNAVDRKSNATPYALAFGKKMDRLLAAMAARGGHF